jgi:3',5'-cyclic-AMP phosphodiesterase
MSSHVSAGGAVINLLQISDCHLTKDSQSELLGVVTRESFAAVLAQIHQDIDAESCPVPDYILATGDIAQDASAEAYHYFAEQIASLKAPSRWFPGNHDDRLIMRAALEDGPELEQVIRAGAWQVILLDSSVTGAVHGALPDKDLRLLEKTLAERPDLHTLISFHHQPVDIGSTWLDKIGLHNRNDFFDIVDRFDNVRGVVWGHIHQEFEAFRDSVRLMATPSTCIQFTPKSHGFGVEAATPGYRWLKLHENGELESKVLRAESYSFNLDLESTGY